MSAIDITMISLWALCAIAFVVIVLGKARAKRRRASREVDDFLDRLFSERSDNG